MLVLGIDTATRMCAAALCRDEKILAEYAINMGMTHSEGLLPQLEQMFQRSGVRKEEVELVAASMGPGSFTGLRIGLATAEALAYAWQCRLHGVNTLAALAYNLPLEGVTLSPVLDAQKGNFYQALFAFRSGRAVELAPAEIVTPERAVERIALEGRPAFLLGESENFLRAYAAYAGEVPAWLKEAPPALRLPKGSSVAQAALADFDAEADKKIFGLEPYYLRRSEAEELWEKKQRR